MMMNLLALAAIFMLSYLILQVIWDIGWSGLRRVPGPLLARFTSFWRVGLIWDGKLPNHIRDLHRKYGSVVRTGPHHVYISDPAYLPVVYSANHHFLKANTYDVFTLTYKKEKFETYLTTQDPDYHRVLRKTLLPRFSISSIKSLEPAIIDYVQTFIQCMEDRVGQTIDAERWAHFWAFDVASVIAFGRPFGFMRKGDDIRGMIGSINVAFKYAAIVGQVPFLHSYLVGNDTLMNFMRSINPEIPDFQGDVLKVIDEQFDAYKQGKEFGYETYLAWICEARQNKENDLSDKDILGSLFVMDVSVYDRHNACTNGAGRVSANSTTATSLTSAFYYLAQNTDCQQCVYEEIIKQSASALDYDKYMSMPYLLAFVKESLRICPVAGVPLERIVPKGGMDVESYHLPAGTNVSIYAGEIHYNPAIYGPDPEKFNPHRWLDTDRERVKLMDRNSLSFGQGSRSCIAQNLGLLEMCMLLVGVLQRFRIEWASDDPHWTVRTFWLPKQENVLVRFVPR